MMPLTAAEAISLTAPRSEAWRYDILDLADRKIGELDGVTGGTFDFSAAATIRSSGAITCKLQDIDWLKVRIQPWYTTTAKGITLTWPIGVYIPATPSASYTGTGGRQPIELYDKLLILDQDKVEETYTAPKGATVTVIVRSLLAGVGETRVALTDSTETVKTAMVWEAGDSKLKIINDLLDSINYFALWVDGYGTFQGTPYRRPGLRGLAWEFRDDRYGIYRPEFVHDMDAFNVPNKVVLVSTSDGDAAALTAEARNENPDSPYSYSQRGRWITTVETGVEATSQAVLNGLVQRRLTELSAPTSTFDIEHALLPLDLNDPVQFARATEGIDALTVVQQMTVSTAVGALVKTTLRGVQA